MVRDEFDSKKLSMSLFSSLRSMAGLMCATAFMSMWINNSAATSIMIPAAIAIVDELENYEKKIFSNHPEVTLEIVPNDIESKQRKRVTNLEEESTKDLFSCF